MDSVPHEIINGSLRANLVFFGIACVVLLAGVSALLLWRLRSRDHLLLWVGVFSGLYGIRLFIENQLVREAFNASEGEFQPWVVFITFLINIPYALFARELLGHGWKGAITIWPWLDVAFATIAIPVALIGHEPYWTNLTNSILVVSGTAVVVLEVALGRAPSRSFTRSLLWPLLIFAIFVVLENKRIQPGGINMEPIGFLVLLAGFVSIAVRRALATERKLMDVEHELTTARRIQNSILPDAPPQVPRLQLALRYRPMTFVAGDFYDFLRTGDHLLTILVADVSGHGVPAALVASMLKVCFAAQREKAHSPAEILTGLNMMLGGSLGGQYVTAACAAINSQTGSITYAGAGHPPGLLLQRQAGSVAELAENGLFIGPFPQATYSNLSVPLQSGDALLLYTDGIVEANVSNGEEFGRERLGQLLLESAGEKPEEFIDLLFRKITTPEQQDDLTAVLAQFE